jgi:DNA-directed RNA polymerase subunit RPC12/RpoP
MICKRCNREFNDVIITKSEPYDRGDGVIYRTPGGWTSNDICPYCGHDNSIKTYI